MQSNINPGAEPDNQSYAEDPDVLRDLIQQARGVPLNVQRITSQEIKALKVTSRKEDKAGVSFARAFTGLFGGFFTAIGAMFAPRMKKRSQCDMYGHVRPRGTWSGIWPKCEECGAEITSDDMVRGSTARH